MKRYEDYKKLDNKSEYLTKEEMDSIRWTKYKIVVPTEEDREEIMEALEHFHDEGYDSDFITANQLAHEYLAREHNRDKYNIIVDSELYEKLNK